MWTLMNFNIIKKINCAVLSFSCPPKKSQIKREKLKHKKESESKLKLVKWSV